jgi:hypothetical protein
MASRFWVRKRLARTRRTPRGTVYFLRLADRGKVSEVPADGVKRAIGEGSDGCLAEPRTQRVCERTKRQGNKRGR